MESDVSRTRRPLRVPDHRQAPASAGACVRAHPHLTRLAAAVLLLGVGVDAHAADPVPALPSGTLPVPIVPIAPQANIASLGRVTAVVADRTLTLTQDTARAVISWNSFDIARDSAVVFRQPDANAAVLNRIGGANPSVIQGRLSANGQVYLLNANGIVFGQGAQVNVQSLVAGSLDITDTLFAKGPLTQTVGDPAFAGTSGHVRVEAGATLQSAKGGGIWLFAPSIENAGTLRTEGGQIILGAGRKVYLASSTDTALRGVLVQVDGGGTVTNLGTLVANEGRASLVGLAVNQSGRIFATTSVTANGIVELLAHDQVVKDDFDKTPRARTGGTVALGAGSRIEVLPVADVAATIADSQSFATSRVIVNGRTVRMDAGAAIVAPGGHVSLSAAVDPAQSTLAIPGAAANDARITLDPGAVIDVSGTTSTVLPMARSFVDVELRSNELRDAPLQRLPGSPLLGRTVTVDVRVGTPLADVSGAVGQIGRTAGERLAAGGSIDLRSEGDVALAPAARLDVSGGTVRYLDGAGATTRLMTAAGRIVDIGAARPDELYLGIVDADARKTFQSGYTEGGAAGTITLVAPRATVQAALAGRAVAGAWQRDAGRVPAAGRLVVGQAADDQNSADFHVGSIAVVRAAGGTAAAAVTLSAQALVAGGFGRLELRANEAVTIGSGVALDLGPGGRATLESQRLEVDGTITAPGGAILLATRRLSNLLPVAAAPDIVLGASARLSAAGLWVNESPQGPGSTVARVIDAGSVTLSAQGDVRLARGSVLDVSGGARVDSQDRLRVGAAGALTLVAGTREPEATAAEHSGRLVLDGSLRGFAFQGAGAGGTLSLTSGAVTIGGDPRGVPGELVLDPGFFRDGGFGDLRVTGIDSLVLNRRIDVSGPGAGMLTRVPAAGYDRVASGTALDATTLSRVAVLRDEDRSAARITLAASNPRHGVLTVAADAGIRLDPGRVDSDGGAAIRLVAGRRMDMLGRLEAPAGTIALTMLGNPASTDQDDGYHADQSIWLGPTAQLLARGAARVYRDPAGLRAGDVLDGGSIVVQANKGYVAAAAGAVLDVSGAAGVIDVVQSRGGLRRPLSIASAAGAITFAAREGLFVDATLLGRGGAADAPGGTLTWRLDRQEDLTVAGVQRPAGYPSSDRILVVRSAGGAGSGVGAGTPLPETACATDFCAGLGYVPVAGLADAGFDALVVRSGDRIRVDGGVSLSMGRSVTLYAPILSATAGGPAIIAAPYVALANTDPRYQGARVPAAGGAELRVQSELLDLVGHLTVSGIDRLRLEARGDIRLQGVLTTDPERTDLDGALAMRGALTTLSAQVYPTTLSRFTFAVEGSAAFEGNGAPAAAPLSAAGTLTVKADDIRVGGILRAPFGEIVLQGRGAAGAQAASLVVEDTGVLSVAAVSTIPFGITQNGAEWFYDLGTALKPITALPARRIELDAAKVELRASTQRDPVTGEPVRRATLDVSGGGELSAWEFQPGPGGSSDVLAQAGVFAIVPGLGSVWAPRDWQNDAGGNPRVGDAVYLSGSARLEAGVYALLPAHYALLPGAYRVSFPSGTAHMLASSNGTLADGTALIAGHRTVAGTALRDGVDRGVLLISRDIVQRMARYEIATASAFFAGDGVRAPADAGVLALRTANLVLDAALRMGGAAADPVAGRAAGRAGALDIVADQIRVVADGGTADPGVLAIAGTRLSASGAGSILLGGTRSADGSVTVGAADVTLGANAVVQAAEVVLASTDTITLERDARLLVPVTGAAGTTAWRLQGDGALVRATVAGGPPVQRSGASAGTASTGTVRIADGAGFALAPDAGAPGRVGALAVTIDATRDTVIDPGALLIADSLGVSAGRIGIGDVTPGATGLHLSGDLLARVGSVRDLTLRSYGRIELLGDVALALGGSGATRLTLDASVIAGTGHADLRAGTVTLTNTTGIVAATPGISTAAAPRLHVTATAGDVILGGGPVALDGFGAANLAATGEVSLRGQGALAVGGDLTIAARRVAGASGFDWRLDVSGAFAMERATGGTAVLATPAVGGRLVVAAQTVAWGGDLRAPGAEITLSAVDAVTLGARARVDLSGADTAMFDASVPGRGGTLRLQSERGDVVVAAEARIDVSGSPGGGDAGVLSVSAVAGGFRLDGALAGVGGNGGTGGRFTLDAGAIDDTTRLADRLRSGGFTGGIDWRARGGDLLLSADAVLASRTVQLAADGGSIDVSGRIDATGASGGRIALWGGTGVRLASGAILAARGTDGDGGDVVVGTTSGRVDLQAGATVDVAGGAGGTILLRAPRAGNDVALDLAAELRGPRETVVEAFSLRTGITSIGAGGGAAALSFVTVNTELQNFAAPRAAILARLGRTGDTSFHVRAGVEVRSDDDLRLAADWNLLSARAGGEPGVLTLRAGGDLRIDGSLSDGFATAATGAALQSTTSWSYRLVGGADASAADPIAIGGAGHVTLAAGKLIRTGTGRIDIAAGGDLRFGSGASTIYTAGAPAADLAGFTRPTSLVSNYPERGGDLTVRVGGDIVAVASGQFVNDWLQRQGSVNGTTGLYGLQTSWWVSYADFRQSFGVLGGGHLSLAAGGDLLNVSAAVPTTARTRGTDPTTATLVVTGGGDLDASAGGDIVGGVWFAAKGALRLDAGGSVRAASDESLAPVIALMDSDASVRAGAGVTLQGVFNPTAAPQGLRNLAGLNAAKASWFLTYGSDSALAVEAVHGDVVLRNAGTAILEAATGLQQPVGSAEFLFALYPGTVRARALTGDVRAEGPMSLHPASRGQLDLLAGGSLRVGGALYLADQDPASLPRPTAPATLYTPDLEDVFFDQPDSGLAAHASPLLHAGDAQPVRLYAVGGDVVGPGADAGVLGTFAKSVAVQAGRDIVDPWIVGQNLAPGDVTLVAAGRDVRFTVPRNADTGAQRTSTAAIAIGGPGRVEVLAGRDVDLATSLGVLTRGNRANASLPSTGASVLVAAGLGMDAEAGGVRWPAAVAFVASRLPDPVAPGVTWADRLEAYLRELGDTASGSPIERFAALGPERRLPFATQVFAAELQATGMLAASARARGDVPDYGRSDRAIATLFPSAGTTGEIRMFLSQIKTERGGDIDLLAPAGRINAGLASPPAGLADDPSRLGVVTVNGGAVRAFAKGDILVNQSRIFTLAGGDILLWSDRGDIDAGRGRKGVTYAPPPVVIVKPDGTVEIDASAAVSGSGIATLLTRSDVVPGDVFAYTPRGSIDAGEAGIRSAGNFYFDFGNLFANRDNVAVGGRSVGVAAPADLPSATVSARTTTGTDNAGAISERMRSAQPATVTSVVPVTYLMAIDVLGWGAR